MTDQKVAFCPLCDELLPCDERTNHIYLEHGGDICKCIICKIKLINIPIFPHIHTKWGYCLCIKCGKQNIILKKSVEKLEKKLVKKSVKKSVKKLEKKLEKKLILKQYFCVTCKLPFSTRKEFRKHIYIHYPSKKKNQCDDCGKWLSSKTNLLRHKRRYHYINVEYHMCKVCGYKCIRKDVLKAHVKNHFKFKVYL